MNDCGDIPVVWCGKVFHLTPHAPNAYLLPFAAKTRSVLWVTEDDFIVDALVPGDSRPIDLRDEDPLEAVRRLEELYDARGLSKDIDQ